MRTQDLSAKYQSYNRLMAEIEAMNQLVDLNLLINIPQQLEKLHNTPGWYDLSFTEQQRLDSDLSKNIQESLQKIAEARQLIQQNLEKLESAKQNVAAIEKLRGNIEASVVMGEVVSNEDISGLSSELETHLNLIQSLHSQFQAAFNALEQVTSHACAEVTEIIEQGKKTAKEAEEQVKKRVVEEEKIIAQQEQQQTTSLRMAWGHVTKAKSELEKFLKGKNLHEFLVSSEDIRSSFSTVVSPADIAKKMAEIKTQMHHIRHALQNAGILDEQGKMIIDDRTKEFKAIFTAAAIPTVGIESSYSAIYAQAKKDLAKSEGFDENLILLRDFCELSDQAVDKMAAPFQKAMKEKVLASHAAKLQSFEADRQKISALQTEIVGIKNQVESEEKEKVKFARQNSAMQLYVKMKQRRREIGLTTAPDDKREARERRKKREETLTTYDSELRKKIKEQKELIKKMAKEIKLLKTEEMALNDFAALEIKRSDQEIKEEVVIHTAALADPVFSAFSTHLENNQRQRTKLIKFLENGFQEIPGTKEIKLQTGPIQRIFDDMPEPTLYNLFYLESDVVLFSSIAEMDDPIIQKKYLHDFIVSGVVDRAREIILTNEGALRPELLDFLNKEYPKFTEIYAELTPSQKKEVENCLIFSLTHAAMAAIEYKAKDKIHIQRYQEFNKSIQIADIINDSITAVKPAVNFTLGSSSFFKSESPSSSSSATPSEHDRSPSRSPSRGNRSDQD